MPKNLTGKKGKKTKGTTLSLNDFLGDEVQQVVVADWASEMENVDIGSSDYDYGAPKIVIDRKQLPSAPRAARGTIRQNSRSGDF